MWRNVLALKLLKLLELLELLELLPSYRTEAEIIATPLTI